MAALGAKLCEEAQEAQEAIGSRRELVEELADVQEVLTALKNATGIADEEVARLAVTKARERGGFEGGAWLTSPPETSAPDDQDIASLALGLLTATYADRNNFGTVTVDYLSAVGNNTAKVIRIATGMTALARVLIGMRQAEIGASHEDTLAELGRRVQELFPD